MRRNDSISGAGAHTAAFTLVELVLVMALLCVILALAAPSLSRSIRGRNLTDEATRFLAITEYARDEAMSQGVPMEVWIDTTAGQFGAKALAGYEDSGARSKQFTLMENLHFDPQQKTAGNVGDTYVAEFTPDGNIDPTSQATVRILDHANNPVEVDQDTDGWAYEIVTNPQQK